MNKRLVRSLVIIIFLLVIFQVAESSTHVKGFVAKSPFVGASNVTPKVSLLPVVKNEVEVVALEEPEVPAIEETELYLSYIRMGYTNEQFYTDIENLAGITEAEAGNQSELGKRLVIDVVLNRIDSNSWRDDLTIWEVIAHPYQFETYTTGAYMRVSIPDRTYELIEEEILNRTNYDVIYFKTGGYFDGLPALFQEGDHWFSGESEY